MVIIVILMCLLCPSGLDYFTCLGSTAVLLGRLVSLADTRVFFSYQVCSFMIKLCKNA